MMKWLKRIFCLVTVIAAIAGGKWFMDNQKQ